MEELRAQALPLSSCWFPWLALPGQVTAVEHCDTGVLKWCSHVFTRMHTDAYMNAHRCSPLCSQATELSHGSADWKSNVQGWQVPCLVGIWFLVCNGTMSLCNLLQERGLESLQGANGIQ